MRGIGMFAALVAVAAALWLYFDGRGSGRRAGRDPADIPAPEAARTAPPPAEIPAAERAAEDAPPAPEEEVSAALSGTVVRVDGTPVTGARVRAWAGAAFEWSRDAAPRWETTTDALGAFTLKGLHGTLVILAEADGLACREALVGRLVDGTHGRDARIVMDEARTWTGRIVDAEGRAVAGATVRTQSVETLGDRRGSMVLGLRRPTPTDRRTRTDGNGEFTIGPLPRGAWSLRAAHPDHAQWDGRLPADGGHVEVRLAPGVMVDGVVRDWNGKPVAGAKVEAHSLSPVRRAVTDAAGRFEIRGLRDWDKLHLEVRARDAARCVVVPTPGRRRGMDIRLESARMLRGVVVDGGGRPLRGIPVRVTSERRWPGETRALVDTSRSTNDDGVFAAYRLPAGRYTVRAGETSLEAEAGHEVRIVYRAADALVVEGTVRDARTGKPVPAFVLTGGRRRAPRRSKDGSFRMEYRKSRSFRLEVRAEGYATWYGPLEKGHGPLRYDVRLHRAVHLRLRVLGAPEFLAVRFESRDGRRIEPYQQSGIGLKDGQWSGHGLPQTRFRVLLVSAIVDGAYRRWTFDLDLSDGRPAVREIVVDPAAAETVKR